MNYNNFTTQTDFDNAKNVICSKYPNFIPNNIRGIFIKEFLDADIITSNKSASSGHTTHIACTGESRGFFYPILGNLLANTRINQNNTFPIFIDSSQIFLSSTTSSFIPAYCTLWVIPKSPENQLGLSKKNFDSDNFTQLRKNIFPHDIGIFFKYEDSSNCTNIYLTILNHSIDSSLITQLHLLPTMPKYYEI